MTHAQFFGCVVQKSIFSLIDFKIKYLPSQPDGDAHIKFFSGLPRTNCLTPKIPVNGIICSSMATMFFLGKDKQAYVTLLKRGLCCFFTFLLRSASWRSTKFINNRVLSLFRTLFLSGVSTLSIVEFWFCPGGSGLGITTVPKLVSVVTCTSYIFLNPFSHQFFGIEPKF
jgi:hypothetical protein